MKNIGSIYLLDIILGKNDLKLASSWILPPPGWPQTSQTHSFGVTLTPTFTMEKKSPDYLLTLSQLASTFNEQGKTDEAIALIYQLIEECYPHILERAKTDKTVIYELIKQKNCKDKKLALEAENLLQYLKLRGIKF